MVNIAPVSIAAHPVVASLTPVFLLIAVGYLAGRLNWIRDTAVGDLSNLVFLVLIPALLFRTMSSVHIEQLDLTPVAAYFLAAIGLILFSVAWRGFDRRSVVMALAGAFSNMVMIGITLVELAYGQAALVTLLRPRVEPSRAGLTIMGAPSACKACSVSVALATNRQSGVGRPSARQRRLVMILSIAMLEASTPEPV